MATNTSRENLPLSYFVLVFLLAIPFWMLGGRKLPLPINLPEGALVTFVPVTAASMLMYRRGGLRAVLELIKKAFDYKRIRNRIWYLPAFALMPLIYLFSYVVMRLIGLPLPNPIKIPLSVAPVFFIMFFIGDAGEELGWSGYAIEPMQQRWGAFRASLILGIVWAIWHSIPYVQTGNPPSWVLWQSLSAIALRILIVWIYNNTGKSVFAAIVFHDMVNISWSMFPNYGSHFNPFLTGLIIWVAVGIVMFLSDPKTLTRHGIAERGRARATTL